MAGSKSKERRILEAEESKVQEERALVVLPVLSKVQVRRVLGKNLCQNLGISTRAEKDLETIPLSKEKFQNKMDLKVEG